MTARTQSRLEFDPQYRPAVVADFAGGTVTPDGGALLLRQVERCLGFPRRLPPALATSGPPGSPGTAPGGCRRGGSMGRRPAYIHLDGELRPGLVRAEQEVAAEAAAAGTRTSGRRRTLAAHAHTSSKCPKKLNVADMLPSTLLLAATKLTTSPGCAIRPVGCEIIHLSLAGPGFELT